MDRAVLGEFVVILKYSLNGERYGGRLTWDVWEPLQALANLSMADVNKRELLDTDLLTVIQRVFIEKPDDIRYFI